MQTCEHCLTIYIVHLTCTEGHVQCIVSSHTHLAECFPVTMQVIDDEKENPGQMAYAYKMTWIWAITLSIVIFVLWPLLALPAGIFSRGYFTLWVIISMVRTSSKKPYGASMNECSS